MIDDGRLIAWLDGELGPEEARAVAAAVEADPDLATRAEAHRQVADRLRSAFAVVLKQALRPALTDAVGGGAAEVVSLDRKRALRQPPTMTTRRLKLPVWARIAAIAPLAFAAGYVFRLAAPDRLMAERDGRLVAAGGLAHALDVQLASTQPGSSAHTGAIRILLSFRARDGRVCRSWTTVGQAGIACHDGPTWTVAATAAVPREAGQYRMASGGDPGLLATMDAMVAEGPFNAAEEACLRQDQWRRSVLTTMRQPVCENRRGAITSGPAG